MFEDQEADVVDPEHDDRLILVGHVRSKVPSYDYMPASSDALV